ncbi:MAG: hypothetical protein H0T76_16995 [Nannocystis sp.]|nr:hypothetical protein [Nannocystis sp.]MBA3548181.1 hypothetical protein [Nannocystis sp.]
MDPGAGAAALAVVRRAGSLAPDAAAEALRGALAGHSGDLTIADAAARSGLALRDAELGLHRLLQLHRGHLSVTDRGELLFRFPNGLARHFAGVPAMMRWLARAGLGVVRWTARFSLTLFLLGYGSLAALGISLGIALALAALTEDATPFEGVGYVLWAVLELFSDALYWSVHPLLAPDEFAEAGGRRPRALYQRVNGFFLGPPRPRDDPKSAARVLVAEIRARQGRIGLGDVVRVTGLAPEPAGALVSRLLLDYDGEVDVSDEGAIVYAFPALRPSVGEPAVAPPAIWQRVRELQPFTGNRAGSNVAIVAATAMIAIFGWFGMSLGLPLWAAQVPFYGSLALLAWVLLRFPWHLAARRVDRAENGRRALLRLAHEGATRRSGVTVASFMTAWQRATDGEIAADALQRLLIELGGDVVTDDDGQGSWRFPTLELELGALAVLRAEADASEREVGEVEFSSLPEHEDGAVESAHS